MFRPAFLTAFLLFSALLQAQPGQDAYGYSWQHSDSVGGPVFSWIDITGMGTQVQGLGDDNVVGPVELGFSFPYYWYQRDRIWIGDNGFIAFGPVGTIADIDPIGFPAFPTADAHNDLLAPMMTDLTFEGTGNPGQVWTYSDLVLRRFVISFTDVPFYGSNAQGYRGSNSFQIILDARDSSITFQYLSQQGSIDSIFSGRLRPVVAGIEDVTGNFGLQVSDTLPGERTAIRFSPPPVPLLEVKDLTPLWLATPDNKGFFTPFPRPKGITPLPVFVGEIANLGSSPFTSAGSAHFAFIHSAFSYFDSLATPDTFPQVAAIPVAFHLPFEYPFVGTYTLALRTDHPEDLHHGNDTLQVEMVVVDTLGGQALLSYASGNTESADGVEVRSDSSLNSGLAVHYQPFGYPVYIEAVDLFLSPYPDTFLNIHLGDGYRIAIYGEGPHPGQPGPILYSYTRPANEVTFSIWERHNLPQPLRIDSAGFYVAWFPLNDSLALLSESAGPVSRQSYEIQEGIWKTHRANFRKDFWMRVLLDVSELPGPLSLQAGPDRLPALTVYPNPARGQVTVDLHLSKAQPVTLQVFDLYGRLLLSRPGGSRANWREALDLSGLAPGAYLIRVVTPQGVVAQRLCVY